MTPLAWLYMGVVWLAITALNVFCFYRIFARNEAPKNGDDAEKDKPLI